jgi:hypothetical protein
LRQVQGGDGLVAATGAGGLAGGQIGVGTRRVVTGSISSFSGAEPWSEPSPPFACSSAKDTGTTPGSSHTPPIQSTPPWLVPDRRKLTATSPNAPIP